VPFAGKRISMDTSRSGTSVMGLPSGVALHHQPSPQAAVPTRRDAPS
jgi:hypothetical protein